MAAEEDKRDAAPAPAGGGDGRAGARGSGSAPAPAGGDRAARADSPAAARPSVRRRNACVFAPLVILWLAADLATKAYFNGFPVGSVVAGPFAGIFRLRLVHNTGAAWGMFDQSTLLLGAFSLVVCAALTAYLFAAGRRASVFEVVGVALVVAGGLGNAIDRFTLGYVVDFIEPVFIDFPTFNVADIGVTCGFVIFFLAVALRAAHEGQKGGSACD